MSISLNYAALSDVGLVRKNNQDAGYASQNLIALADGMGGAAAGDVASSVTIAHLAQADDVHAVDDLLPTLRHALVAAQQELADRVREDPAISGLGTTCIALMRANNKLAMIHIGDSRAYLLRAETLTQVTHDHTLVQYLVDHGELSEEEAAHHPKRNVIMRAISHTPESVDLDESIREAIPGDRWLLCSDGLFGVVSKETIRATLLTYKDIHECAEVLISLALAGGAPDNVTVVLADVLDDEQLPADMHVPNEPIVVGSAAADYFSPTRAGKSSAGQAAALLEERAPVPAVEAPAGTSRSAHFIGRIIARIAIALLVLGIIGVSAWGGYNWTQTQYFVAPSGQYVAIYQGIPQQIGALSLFHVQQVTDLKVAQLTATAQKRLEAPITRTSLKEAQLVVENLRTNQKVELADTPTVTEPDAPAVTESDTPTTTEPNTPAAADSDSAAGAADLPRSLSAADFAGSTRFAGATAAASHANAPSATSAVSTSGTGGEREYRG